MAEPASLLERACPSGGRLAQIRGSASALQHLILVYARHRFNRSKQSKLRKNLCSLRSLLFKFQLLLDFLSFKRVQKPEAVFHRVLWLLAAAAALDS